MKNRLALLLLVLLCIAHVSIAAVGPKSGTFEGVYHQDKRGVGRFGDFYVHPKLHDQLAHVQGKRIRLEVLEARQAIRPGPSLIHQIGGFSLLEEASLTFDVSVVPSAKKDEYALVIWLINQETKKIELSVGNLRLELHSPQKVARPEKPSFKLSPYTRGQVATKQQSIQWLNNHLVNHHRAFELGQNVTIEPDERFPVATFIKDPIWPLELRVKCPVRMDSKVWNRSEAWQTVKRPISRKSLTLLPSVSASNVSLSPYSGFPPMFVSAAAVDPGQRISFVLKPRGKKAVKIATCSEAANLIAGTIATKSGLMLEVLPNYSCSNVGSPWLLRTLPEAGLPVTLVTKKVDEKIYTLQLLTEHGLETVRLSVDP